MKKLILLLPLLLTSCGTDHEWAWYILSPNKVNGLTNLKFLLSGIGVTIYISLISIIISMFLGFIIAIPSLAKNKFLTYINIAYVEIVRAIPLLVLILSGESIYQAHSCSEPQEVCIKGNNKISFFTN